MFSLSLCLSLSLPLSLCNYSLLSCLPFQFIFLQGDSLPSCGFQCKRVDAMVALKSLSEQYCPSRLEGWEPNEAQNCKDVL